MLRIQKERPGCEPFAGKPAILDFYLTKRIISLGQQLVEKMLSDGVNIAYWGSFSGVVKNGRDLSMRFADVCRIREGEIDLRGTFETSAIQGGFLLPEVNNRCGKKAGPPVSFGCERQDETPITEVNAIVPVWPSDRGVHLVQAR